MEDSTNFTQTLENAINAKTENFNTELLPRVQNNYRLLFTCVKNLNDFLAKKSIINPDPYAAEIKVTELQIPETAAFNENDGANVIGSRLSEYQTILDFLCSFQKFTVENFPISKIKKLQGFNEVFLWDNMSINSTKPNTRMLATMISNSKKNTQAITLSLLNDSLEKSAKSMVDTKEILAQLATFQRENFKLKIRKEIIGSSKFDNSRAFSSPADEFEEIKRLYPELISKKGVPTELIQEIVNEDQGANKEKLQEETLTKLSVSSVTVKKEKPTVKTKDILMLAVFSLGGLAPTLGQLESKMLENIEVLYTRNKNLKSILSSLFRKMFNLKEKERIIDLPVKNSRTNQVTHQKLKVEEFTQNLNSKVRLFSAIAEKGTEYTKIEHSKEDVILPFLNKQISDTQSIYTTLEAFDEYVKKTVESNAAQKEKIKGMKIELSALKASIISINKKRGEYASIREEMEQMKKIGLNNETSL